MRFNNLKISYEPHKWKWWHLPFIIIMIFGTVVIINSKLNRINNSWKYSEGKIFGTMYHISYNSSINLNDSIVYFLNIVDKSLSTFNDSSTLSQVNSNSSNLMDSMMCVVVHAAQNVYEQTGGAFDITVAPLVNAWGFGFKDAENIDSLKIDSILHFVGMNQLTIAGNNIYKSDYRIMLDCSAIAKGYSVDVIANMFLRNNVFDFMIEIGGEIRTSGKNNKNEIWKIGINQPVDDVLSDNHDLQNIIEITNMSIATSGNYRNFYIKNNKKYAHTIDPRSGYPVQHSILSSTVFTKECMVADAYATAFMVMGIEKSKAFLSKHKDIKAYFIYSTDGGENAVWHSDGLKLKNDY